jgi:hypothetical protein
LSVALHRAKYGLCIKSRVAIEGSRRLWAVGPLNSSVFYWINPLSDTLEKVPNNL